MIDSFIELLRDKGPAISPLLLILLIYVSQRQSSKDIEKQINLKNLSGENFISEKKLVKENHLKRSRFYFWMSLLCLIAAMSSYIILKRLQHPWLENVMVQSILYVLLPIITLYFLQFSFQQKRLAKR